uniref:Uncharacterized protein n=1 Tax=Cacopsylla melanoneura TaxID=428564 RepID=A0A8D9F6L5_9HEMI
MTKPLKHTFTNPKPENSNYKKTFIVRKDVNRCRNETSVQEQNRDKLLVGLPHTKFGLISVFSLYKHSSFFSVNLSISFSYILFITGNKILIIYSNSSLLNVFRT